MEKTGWKDVKLFYEQYEKVLTAFHEGNWIEAAIHQWTNKIANLTTVPETTNDLLSHKIFAVADL